MVFEVKNLAAVRGGTAGLEPQSIFFAKRGGLQPQPKFSCLPERGGAGLNH